MISRKLFAIVILATSAIATMAQTQQIRAFSHRGGRMEHDENTLSAFQASHDAGYTGYETDLRMTADGHLVVTHDSNLERTTNGTGAVEKLTRKQIEQLRTKKGHKLMFIDELMAWLKDKKGLYVEFEMKTDDKVKETGAFLYEGERLEEYCNKMYEQCKAKMPKDADWALTSFDHRPLQKIHAQHPEAVLGLITSEGCTEETVKLCKQLGVRRLAALLDKSSRKGVKTAHANRINVNLWPGSKFSDALLAMYLGADYICTDVPMGAMEYLKKNPPGRPYRF